MNTLEVIKTRRSVRNYTHQVIKKADLQEIVESGMYAPSAHNQQPREFLILQDKEQLLRLSKHLIYGKMLAQANVVIIPCFHLTELKAPHFVTQDMGACVENILLAAHAKGIGAVWIGVYPEENTNHFLNEYLHLPQGIEIFNLISLGYPDENVPLWDKKCRFPERIHWGKR
ncbi:MAG: nitroreductase family protein [Candidatus Peribacteria bacterium]|jgi:nitroreductase|nr:nitroreductase family protein [Candidatus Peribacteria bacterium]